MQIRHATRPAPDRPVNEDLVLTGPSYAVVLDGATAPRGDSGCRHDVAWLVAALGDELSRKLPGAGTPLTDLLAEAIDGVRGRHGPGCDLANPDSPSSTVTMLRAVNGAVDYLVLADSPLVLRDSRGAAAYQAVTGTLRRDEVDVAALLSDGASRWAERYGNEWTDLLGILEQDGPDALIDRVHAADREAAEGSFRGKRYDDASAVLVEF